MAQVTIPVQSFPAGDTVSPAVNYSGKDAVVKVQINSPTWFTDPPTTLVKLTGQQSLDNGLTWQDCFAFTTRPRDGTSPNPPYGGFEVHDNFGARKARLILNLTAPLSLGLTITAG